MTTTAPDDSKRQLRGLASVVDVVLEHLNPPPHAAIELRIPREVNFEEVTGGRLRRTEEGAVIVAAPESRRMVLRDVRLEGGARHSAMMTVRMPKEAAPGSTMRVRVSETVKGREMGGIVFDFKKVRE